MEHTQQSSDKFPLLDCDSVDHTNCLCDGSFKKYPITGKNIFGISAHTNLENGTGKVYYKNGTIATYNAFGFI